MDPRSPAPHLFFFLLLQLSACSLLPVTNSLTLPNDTDTSRPGDADAEAALPLVSGVIRSDRSRFLDDGQPSAAPADQLTSTREQRVNGEHAASYSARKRSSAHFIYSRLLIQLPLTRQCLSFISRCLSAHRDDCYQIRDRTRGGLRGRDHRAVRSRS